MKTILQFWGYCVFFTLFFAILAGCNDTGTPSTADQLTQENKHWIETGADVNTRNENGQTLLHAIAYNGSLADVMYLIKKGADVNMQDNNGCTPLYYAAKYNKNVKVIKCLLDFGADPNIKSKDMVTEMLKDIDKRERELVSRLTMLGATNVSLFPLQAERERVKREGNRSQSPREVADSDEKRAILEKAEKTFGK
jgi:hypothetical protein